MIIWWVWQVLPSVVTSRRTYVSVLLLLFHDSLLICLSLYIYIFISLQTCQKSKLRTVQDGFHLETPAPSKNQSRFNPFICTYRKLSRLRCYELIQDVLYRLLPPGVRSCICTYGIICKGLISKIVSSKLGLRIRQARMKFLLHAIEVDFFWWAQ